MLSNLKGYHRPKSIPEALALLEKNSGTILVIAGGTKLVHAQNDRVQELVDISALNLNYIKAEKGVVRVGATTPLQKLVESPILNKLSNAIVSQAALLSQHSKMIRNVSTIGGDLITTDPLSILYCALLVLQAQVRIVGGEEWALAMNIFLNKKGIEGGLLIEVLIPTVNDQTFAAMATISVNQYAAPLIAVCARLSLNKSLCQNVKLAITGTANVPQRLHMAEDLLEGKKLTKANIEMIADSVYEKYKPISDPLASEEYRKEVSRLVVKKALTKCLEHSEEAL